MTVPVIGFFNNKGGVGKTTLVYHVSWMLAEMGMKVLALDLDPQSNLTAAFIDEEQFAQTLFAPRRTSTIYQCVEPLIKGTGDIQTAEYTPMAECLALIPGDMRLSLFEDELSQQWPHCSDGQERAFRVLSAFWRVAQQAAAGFDAEVIIVDMGPNLGAINRSALIGADYFVIPLGPDLFSLQGLENLGPTVARWRSEWGERRKKLPTNDIDVPQGRIQPLGYMVMRHSIRLDRPVQAYDRWLSKIPQAYLEKVLDQPNEPQRRMEDDPNCIAMLKDYRSLMPLAHEARKPMFDLTPADGALGSHMYAVNAVRADFKNLCTQLCNRAGLREPAYP